ncbi:MAG TPA: hypothetical protein VD998_02420 [Verrucomicrobiae bacterium]|nr:hypothetical protein [Verrucomicrobiae bacterium]
MNRTEISQIEGMEKNILLEQCHQELIRLDAERVQAGVERRNTEADALYDKEIEVLTRMIEIDPSIVDKLGDLFPNASLDIILREYTRVQNKKLNRGVAA